MSTDDALPVSSTIWSRFNSSELGRHYQQYPDEYTNADDKHGNEIYPTEPHGMSLSGASNTATITRLYCKFETAIRANRDAFAALSNYLVKHCATSATSRTPDALD
jgi:hypothetical protein